MYKRKYTVEQFMIDANQRLNIDALFHMLNDIMVRNASSYGADADYHLKRNLVWVLVGYEITVHTMPVADMIITVGTLPYSFKRMYGYRVYQIKNDHGDVLVEGKGKFVLMDTRSKTLVAPAQDLLDLFVDAHKDSRVLSFEKFKPSKSTYIHRAHTIVNRTHIDINNHVNNAEYVAFAQAHLPIEYDPLPPFSKVMVNYRKEAFLDQLIELVYYREDRALYVEMLHENDLIATMVFILS